MLRVTVRSVVRRVCLVALTVPLITLPACAERPEVSASEPWPLALSDPAVLGYVVIQPPTGDTLAGVILHAFGWEPDGLAADLPVVLVHFDARTYGGGFGALFPLQDEQAFLASLAAAPTLESLGGDRYRLSIPSDSPLGMMLAVFWRMQGASPISAFSALMEAGSASLALQVDILGQHALIAPSFEALAVCKRLLRETGGFVSAPRESLVLSFDLARMRVGHAEEIRASEQQLRGMISGIRTGSTLAGLMAMVASHESAFPVLPVNWELVWAVKQMLAVSEMDALQLRFDWQGEEFVPEPADDEGEATEDSRSAVLQEWILDHMGSVSLRLAFSDESRFADVLDTLLPETDVAGAEFTLRVDPGRFARAFAEWCRPLAEVVKGEGPPCDRYLDELVELLSGWGGLLAVRIDDDGLPMVLLGMSSEQVVDGEALSSWLQPLLATAHIESLGDGMRVESLPDGRSVFMNAQGEPTLTVGRTGAVLWIAAGASAPPDVRNVNAVEEALGSPLGDGVPGLRFAAGGIQFGLNVKDRELSLDLRPTGLGP